MITAVAGVVGLLLQVTIAIVVMAALRRYGMSFALLGGALVAVYGYGLTQSTLMLFAIPWQVTNALMLVVALSAFAMPGFRANVWAGLCAAGRSARFNWVATTVLAAVVAFQILVNALKPELSIDGQLYHGPILANLVTHGTLWGWTPTNQYAYYTDLTMASSLNLATFTGATWFDDASQVPQLVILMLAVNWALRSRFNSAMLRVALASLLVSAPVIWIQPRILYVDVAYGAAVLVTMIFVALTKHWDRTHILLASIAAAAVLATKPTGILTSAVLALAILIAVGRSEWITRNSDNGDWRRRILSALGILIIPFIAALSFYVRNFFSFSNPVYPVAVKFGAIEFPGIIDLSIFASGERGSGFIDAGRVIAYMRSLWHGVRDGVTKLDYDPRDGGYGHVPLAIALLVVGILVAELIISRRKESRVKLRPFQFWRAQVVLLLLAVFILLIQPSTFDTRYVIGPTAALVIALLLTTFGVALPRLVQTAAAAVAIIGASVQVSWTETHIYPGIKTISELRGLPTEWQPITPGNPWGVGRSVSWIPAASCSVLAIETSGGVTSTGMSEQSYLATLSYGLYGNSLCNTVQPVVIAAYHGFEDGKISATRNPFANAQFAILYTENISRWQTLLGVSSLCWSPLTELSGLGDWPEGVTVMRNSCD